MFWSPAPLLLLCSVPQSWFSRPPTHTRAAQYTELSEILGEYKLSVQEVLPHFIYQVALWIGLRRTWTCSTPGNGHKWYGSRNIRRKIEMDLIKIKYYLQGSAICHFPYEICIRHSDTDPESSEFWLTTDLIKICFNRFNVFGFWKSKLEKGPVFLS